MSLYLLVGMMLVMLSVLMSLVGFMLLGKEEVYLVEYFLCEWGGLDVKYEMEYDWMSCMYSGVVLLISGSVLIYSEDYMNLDPGKGRFFFLMILFIVSMLLSVTSSGLISVSLGWDGLGLVSYCLVIYYESSKSYKAGMITVMSNRIGDALLLISIGWLLSYGDWGYWFIGFEENMNYVVIFMLVLAGCTKSAQIPFSAWLPEAMAAPTPVSSLVHSSTLVTAGVFLLIRLNYMFVNCNGMLMLLSLGTMLVAGLGALVESDMKKVVAMSTSSQLGLMMFCLSLNLWKLAYYHMVIHAFFKALMFLCVGGIIHGVGGNQDFRYIMNKYKVSWIINQGLLVSILCLMGFPYLCGFFSKDLLLEVYVMGEKNLMVWFAFSVGFIMSTIYGIRLFKGSLLGEGMELSYGNFGEGKKMNSGILILMGFSLIMGSVMMWLMKGNWTIIMDGKMKMVGLIMMVMMLFIMYFLLSGEGFYEINFKKLKIYLGSMFFMSYFSGIFSLELMDKMEGTEMSDQIWMEEGGGWGIKENMLKKFFFYHENLEDLNFFLKIVGMVFMGFLIVMWMWMGM